MLGNRQFRSGLPTRIQRGNTRLAARRGAELCEFGADIGHECIWLVIRDGYGLYCPLASRLVRQRPQSTPACEVVNAHGWLLEEPLEIRTDGDDALARAGTL